jgi:nucleoside-diphosphate-sugar epimerase
MQLGGLALVLSSEAKISVVTGATGTIGPALVERLQDAGHHIRVLARRQLPSSFFRDSVQVGVGDICDEVAVGRLMEGADVVFHLAARLHIPDPPPELQAEYWWVNVEGTRNVVQQATAAGVRRLVYISTVTVYGPTDGQVMDESAPPRPDTLYSRTKLEGEQVALAAQRADDEPLTTVLRLATVYGPRQKGNFQRLVRALARGRFVPVGDGRNRRTLVYVRDAVEAMLLAAEQPKAASRVFNVTDGCVHTMRDILTVICQALGRPVPRVYVPLSVAWAGAAGLEYAFALVGRRASLTRAAVSKFVEDAAYSGQRIQIELGFRPAYNLEAGWRETIAELRRSGRL